MNKTSSKYNIFTHELRIAAPFSIQITDDRMNYPDKSNCIIEFVKQNQWLGEDINCSFLAAGEYNENYLLESMGNRYVFRVNHGTQLGLDNQIEYEFGVLEAVSSSGVTPLPFRYSLNPEHDDLGFGVLLMEFISGRPLDYKKDLQTAADIFARIHSLAPDQRLILQKNPTTEICLEAHNLLNRFQPKHYPDVRVKLLKYHDELLEHGGDKVQLFDDETLCIVNTEVNSGNFIINPNRSCLVDWEKSVVSCRYQDLAHFLIATTTLWKTNHRLSHDEKDHFLSCYKNCAELDLPLSIIKERTEFLEKIILLRALSWCYMAYHEYTETERVLSNDFTFNKITSYLDEAQCFFK